MKIDTIYEARKAAKRFNDAANEYLLKVNTVGGDGWTHRLESGAMRRASMDLTRVLSKMRGGK